MAARERSSASKASVLHSLGCTPRLPVWPALAGLGAPARCSPMVREAGDGAGNHQSRALSCQLSCVLLQYMTRARLKTGEVVQSGRLT